MTFICFVESDNSDVPHMEPLRATTFADARVEARKLLAGHATGIIANVFEGERRILSVLRDELPRDRDVPRIAARTGPKRPQNDNQ